MNIVNCAFVLNNCAWHVVILVCDNHWRWNMYVMDDTVSMAYVCTQAVCQTDTGFILLYTANDIKANLINVGIL